MNQPTFAALTHMSPRLTRLLTVLKDISAGEDFEFTYADKYQQLKAGIKNGTLVIMTPVNPAPSQPTATDLEQTGLDVPAGFLNFCVSTGNLSFADQAFEGADTKARIADMLAMIDKNIDLVVGGVAYRIFSSNHAPMSEPVEYIAAQPEEQIARTFECQQLVAGTRQTQQAVNHEAFVYISQCGGITDAEKCAAFYKIAGTNVISAAIGAFSFFAVATPDIIDGAETGFGTYEAYCSVGGNVVSSKLLNFIIPAAESQEPGEIDGVAELADA